MSATRCKCRNRAVEMLNDTNIKVDMIIDKTIFKHIKEDAVATVVQMD
jgi:phospholipid/cholesterol/gamma-HCH transport system substrate-binding protein